MLYGVGLFMLEEIVVLWLLGQEKQKQHCGKCCVVWQKAKSLLFID